MENDRTSQKITDLKEKLTSSQNRGGSKRRSPEKQQQPVYSKSFKGGYGGGVEPYFADDVSPQSSGKRSRGYDNPYRYQGSAQR